MPDRPKFFIFSDEAGSWHNEADIYVRSWVVIAEDEYLKLTNKVTEISSTIGSNELKWKTIAANERYFGSFDDVDYRIFVTVSSPKDIHWDNKYSITRDFSTSVSAFKFGKLDTQLQAYIKDRIYREIKNSLFLHLYEKQHIENAKKGIERVIKPTDYDLFYRVDPPQLPHEGWRNALRAISVYAEDLEFPRSERSQGIQFADIVAGCFRSLLLQDSSYDKACEFYKLIKVKFIKGDSQIPNPNLIFFQEINEELKKRCQAIWNL
jgi:hypothetical protein